MGPSNDPPSYAVYATVDDLHLVMTVSSRHRNYDIRVAIIFGEENKNETMNYTGISVAWMDFNSMVRKAVYGTLRPLIDGKNEGTRGHTADVYFDEIKEMM